MLITVQLKSNFIGGSGSLNWPVMYTVAPALARTKAIPLPIPREAPVTMHTLPASEGSSEVAMLNCDITRKV